MAEKKILNNGDRKADNKVMALTATTDEPALNTESKSNGNIKKKDKWIKEKS